jgi:ankyrin repeat protein
MLRETGKFDIDRRLKDGWTPLSSAINKSKENVVKILLNTSVANLEVKSWENSRTPLSLVLENGYEGIVGHCFKQANSMSMQGTKKVLKG